MSISLVKRPLADRIGSTFKSGPWTIRLDVEPDDGVGPDDFDCYTARQRRGWVNSEWEFVGVIATVSLEGIELGESSLWGIERGWFPLTDEADELTVEPVEYLDVDDDTIRDTVREAVAEARKSIARLVERSGGLRLAS